MSKNQKFCRAQQRVTLAALRLAKIAKVYGNGHSKTILAFTFFKGWDRAADKYFHTMLEHNEEQRSYWYR